jgi:hypothetical protein
MYQQLCEHYREKEVNYPIAEIAEYSFAEAENKKCDFRKLIPIGGDNQK